MPAEKRVVQCQHGLDNLSADSAENLPMDNDRRVFLNSSALLLSALALSACGGGGSDSTSVVIQPSPVINEDDTPGALRSTTQAQRIVIIGAGIAGLVAAYELNRAGHDITILEARERLGGRVHTLTSPFTDGQFAEAGASRIPSDHDLTLAYADHFDLALDPFYATSGNYALVQGNLLNQVAASNYINQPPWPGSVNRSAFSKIRGGMSQLPLAFAQNLNEFIFFNAIVTSVEQSDEQVIISTEDGQLHSADRLLCTVPLPVLNKIRFVPALSTQKTQAAGGAYNYSPSARLYSQFGQRFWQNQGLNGWGETDRPEEIWQPSWDDAGSRGILMSYLRGSTAAQFDTLTAQQQLDSILQKWEIAFPGANQNLTNQYIFSWTQEEFSGSAFANPTQSQESAYGAHIGLAEGRIHFAGEHASSYHAWIQGALESGIRAAREIHAV